MTFRRVPEALLLTLLVAGLRVTAHNPHTIHLKSGKLELDARWAQSWSILLYTCGLAASHFHSEAMHAKLRYCVLQVGGESQECAGDG